MAIPGERSRAAPLGCLKVADWRLMLMIPDWLAGFQTVLFNPARFTSLPETEERAAAEGR